MYEKEEEEIVMDEDNEVLAVDEDEEMNNTEDDEVEAEMEIDVNEVEEKPRHEQDRSSDGSGSPRKKQKIKNWNFIKIHSHVHAADDIQAKGVSRNYNTKPNEKSHGQLKHAHQRTNFKNIEGQVSFVYLFLLLANTSYYILTDLKDRSPISMYGGHLRTD